MGVVQDRRQRNKGEGGRSRDSTGKPRISEQGCRVTMSVRGSQHRCDQRHAPHCWLTLEVSKSCVLEEPKVLFLTPTASCYTNRQQTNLCWIMSVHIPGRLLLCRFDSFGLGQSKSSSLRCIFQRSIFSSLSSQPSLTPRP